MSMDISLLVLMRREQSVLFQNSYILINQASFDISVQSF